MKILVTGSNGFVGKHLIELLRKKKHTIVEGTRAQGLDITQKETIPPFLKGVDVVIHAAAEVDEDKGEEHLQRVNVEGTRNMLEAAGKARINQFIFISSVGVYGYSPQKLDENSPMEPTTGYERSKADAEKAVQEYQEEFDVTIIRPALVLGANTYWKQIFSIIRKGFPLIGSGENAWQMIYVKDLAEFIVQCVGNADAAGETYICAERDTYTLRQVVDMIADIQGVKHVGNMPAFLGMLGSYFFLLQRKLTGKKVLLIPAHVKRLGKHREYDISKALSLGWKPRYSTKEALAETYAELQQKK